MGVPFNCLQESEKRTKKSAQSEKKGRETRSEETYMNTAVSFFTPNFSDSAASS
jgi:hypothetical protein